MSRDSKMCAAQFAKGMGIGLGVGMAVGAAAGLMMQPQKKRANGIVADAVRTVSDVTDTIRDTMGWYKREEENIFEKVLAIPAELCYYT